MSTSLPPDALLFIAPGCPHCPAVLQALGEMVKQAAIGRLEVINVTAHPEQAATHGVRTVPWLRLGDFELTGAQTAAELQHWLKLASQADGITRYLEELLRDGQLQQAEQQLAQHPDWLKKLLPLLEKEDTPLQVRLGISALFEAHAGHAILQELIPDLAQLSKSTEQGLRADIAYYLSLSGSQQAIPWLEKLGTDESGEVREIAGEGLDSLRTRISGETG